MAKVFVIGGGAAGMMAAGTAAQRGHQVHLFERNQKLGKKIYITGKGRCNVTNAGNVEDFIAHIPQNPYFLYSALYAFDSQATRDFFHQLHIETKVERGNRVFPVSDKAQDIVKGLETYLKKQNVQVHLGQRVQSLLTDQDRIKGIRLFDGRELFCDSVIVATGGLSYPATGSTGDGYEMAKDTGHTVTKRLPALVPLRVKEDWCSQLMGLSLKNAALQIKDKNGKKLYEDFGEMLFTHYGISGPMVLSASSQIVERIGNQEITAWIDLKPALDEKTLDQRILRDFQAYANKDFKNALHDLLPQKMIPVVVSLSGIDGSKKPHDITKEERKRLIHLLKGLKLTITGTMGFQEAVITRGGVSVEQVQPGTMESKIVKNLYFAGEVLDVDGYTGGYNLQIAFSTGVAAGNHI